MATATSYDLPQYVGELFQKQERPNAFLRLIGGLTGMLRTVGSTEYPMGVDYEVPEGQQPDVVEAAAPSASHISTNQASNVVQIFQEAVDISYSRLGASAAIDGVSIIPGAAGAGELVRPGTTEWQIARKVEKIARDANYTFLRGAYQKPTDNMTSRRTRGARTAVTTNLFANGGTPRPLTKPLFEGSLKSAMDNGMFQMGDAIYALGVADQIENLVDLYKSETSLPESRTVAGVQVRTIVTTWCTINVTYEPDLAPGELFLTRPEFCRVVNMPIPNKGTLFLEPLAKTKSSEEAQLYGEFGIDYRHEIYHAVIDDLEA